MEPRTSLILASFTERLGAARAAGAVIAEHHRAIGSTALGDVVPGATAQHRAAIAWSSGRAAMLTDALDSNGCPLRLGECSSPDPLEDALRVLGPAGSQRARFGAALRRGDSVVVFEIETGAAEAARSTIEALGPRAVLVAPFDRALGALRDCVDECLDLRFAA